MGGEAQLLIHPNSKKCVCFDMLYRMSFQGSMLLTFTISCWHGKGMLFWQTPVEDVPLAIAPFQGRVLVGVGKLLRIYDLGKKKLLRKCENKVRRELDVTNKHKNTNTQGCIINYWLLCKHKTRRQCGKLLVRTANKLSDQEVSVSDWCSCDCLL